MHLFPRLFAERPGQDESLADARSVDVEADTERLRKGERDLGVLTGQLPIGTEELALIDEYRLANWLSGPGR